MYTGPLCNFVKLKRLFTRNNIKYQEIDISSKRLMEEMIKKSNGRKTIPQIFDDQYIGGYEEVRALEKANYKSLK